jgi:hypothetical protein
MAVGDFGILHCKDQPTNYQIEMVFEPSELPNCHTNSYTNVTMVIGNLLDSRKHSEEIRVLSESHNKSKIRLLYRGDTVKTDSEP